MRFSSKTRIAVQALCDLALHGRGRQAQAKEISRRQQIPVRTLEEVLQELRKVGLVEAQRGPRGGYTLARPPEEITMFEIVGALEGPVEQLFAPRQAASSRRGRGRRPAPRMAANGDWAGAASPRAAGPDVSALVWGDLGERIAAVLGQATLGDFVARAQRSGGKAEQSEPPPTMYVI